ncbi:MAG TPA: hypothetical protein VHD33_07730, partial [Legionellaceae bacterium]|nr:hypothetical protein [Legionellaceae bacterium]
LQKNAQAHLQKKVAIFGASFNPVTVGHMDFIRVLLREPFASIRIIPAAQSPLKSKNEYASVTDRLAMLQMSLKSQFDVKDQSRLCIERLELDRAAPSRMVVTLVALILLKQASERYTLACGYDHFSQMTQWYRWQTLAGLCQLAFYPREKISIVNEVHVAHLKQLCQAGFQISIIFLEQETKAAFAALCSQDPELTALMSTVDLRCDPCAYIRWSSATDIRAYYQLSSEVIAPEGMIPEVHDYILKHCCYRNNKNESD